MMIFKRKLNLSYACMMVVAATMAESVYAQDAEDKKIETVTVTGTRIKSSTFETPTPTSVMGSEEIEKTGQPNVFESIAQMPALQGSQGKSNQTFSTSSGVQGLSSLAMRGLGTQRTLTMLDGQRVTPANFNGATDVSLFPQLLIERVDVVQGGASASYGSDAVGGVVNFITKKDFVGFKGNLVVGQSTYGDAKNITGQAAWGDTFMEDKLHITLSAEKMTDDGVPTGGFGMNAANGRDWYISPSFQRRSNAATVDKNPQLIYTPYAQNIQYSKYGLITAGPLQGTAFDVNGNPYQFDYGVDPLTGVKGVPSKAANGAVTNCISPFCSGGELDGNVGIGTTLAAELDRTVSYSRVAYDLSDDLQVYANLTLAKVEAQQNPNPGAARNANLTIQCDNPYLPQSIKDQCTANNITNFQYGTANAGFPNFISVEPVREQKRVVTGLEGKFDIGSTSWDYDSYAQYGETRIEINVNDIALIPRYLKAIDAYVPANIPNVQDGAGMPVANTAKTIYCRDPVAVAAGCQPMNIIGGKPSAASLAYVLPESGPRPVTLLTQKVFAANLSGHPFELWAGEVGVATGVEYREEAYNTTSDVYGNGPVGGSYNSPDYPADPILNSVVGNNWYAGNYHSGQGAFHVSEAFVELNLPLMDNGVGKIDITLADRIANYSTAGTANTWKIGANWSELAGVSGLAFRAVTSKDLRAPNLQELYSPEVATNAQVKWPDNPTAPVAQQINKIDRNVQQRVSGNVELEPESANSTNIGFVLNGPDFAPNFSASIDYFQVEIEGGIGNINLQSTVDLCLTGTRPDICGALNITPTDLSKQQFVKQTFFNLASIDVKGIDLEMAYKMGDFTLRGAATHNISFKRDPGVIGLIELELAGTNGGPEGGSTPDWEFNLSQSWDTDTFSVQLSERFFTDGVYSNEAIECEPGTCPVSTDVHPTITAADNKIKGAFYLDLSTSYNINDNVTAYFNVDNLLNKDPEPVPQTGVGTGVNPNLYDLIGRMYRAGVRVSFD